MSWKRIFQWAALLFFAWVTIGVVISLITIGPVEDTCTTLGGPNPNTECATEVYWLAVVLAAAFLGSSLLGLLSSILALRSGMRDDRSRTSRISS